MAYITLNRDLLLRLVDRWHKLEIENRGFRAMLEEAKRRDPARAKDIEALYQMQTDSLRNDPEWIEFDSESGGALATEDDAAFLQLLDRFLSRREIGQ